MAKRKNLSKSVRFEVFKRDSFTCQYCGKSAPDVVLEVDHIIPVAKGGDNDLSNLITACFDCNRGKRDKKLTDKQSIKLQKEELDKLNTKREQLEMIAKWRKELLNLTNDAIDKIIEIVNEEYFLDISLTDSGRKTFSNHIKKYGFDEVLESTLIAFDTYSDLETAVNKIGGILYNRKMDKENPAASELKHIVNIARKNFNYFDNKVAYTLVNTAYKYKASLESLKEFTLECRNWSQWKDGIDRYINKYKSELGGM